MARQETPKRPREKALAVEGIVADAQQRVWDDDGDDVGGCRVRVRFDLGGARLDRQHAVDDVGV